MQNLIITRFPHGAAGKFLSTVLQTSNRVDHWSPVVQHQKKIKQYVKEITLAYCHRVFPIDHNLHMEKEPMVPYCTDLYSSTFDRGQDVTVKQYWQQNDIRLHECKIQNLYANVIFNKPNLPVFCNGAKVLTVLLTTKQEQDWVHQALWSKHFIKQDDKIIYSPSSPLHCHLSAVPKLLHYQPKYCFEASERDELYNRYILNNSTILEYTQPHSRFNDNVDNMFLNISDLFLVDRFIAKVEKVFSKFDLGKLDSDLVVEMHKVWWSRQCK
jgi:hypothetical protein